MEKKNEKIPEKVEKILSGKVSWDNLCENFITSMKEESILSGLSIIQLILSAIDHTRSKGSDNLKC